MTEAMPAACYRERTNGATRCVVDHCDRKASPLITILPVCHQHGLAIAEKLSDSVIARHELRKQQRAAELTEARETKAGNRETGTVYYARIGDYIKIGYSARLKNRLKTLRIDELLAVEPGDPALERLRHQRFDAERIDKRRENFRPSERLTAHIADLLAANGLPRWAQLPSTSLVTVRHQEPK